MQPSFKTTFFWCQEIFDALNWSKTDIFYFLFSLFHSYCITIQAQPESKYDLCSQVSLSGLLLTVVPWQRDIDLLEEGAGIIWQFGTLSIIKILGLLYFLAYFSAPNPNGVEQCKSEKLSWV